MDVAPDQSTTTTTINQASHLSALLHALLGVVLKPVDFFLLSKEDRLKAGIYLDGESRESNRGDN